MLVLDKVLMAEADDGTGGRPEVNRGDLRNMLLAGTEWGKKLAGAKSLGEKGYVETYLYSADERHAPSAKAVGTGAMMALSHGKGVMAHREPNNVLHTYVALHRSKEWIQSIDFNDTSTAASTKARARVAAEFDGWAPEIRALITDGESAPVLRMLHTLPADHRWARGAAAEVGVTLLGDAAHLMIPSGEGANLAMFDGAELGKAIAAAAAIDGNFEAALQRFEEDMFKRSGAEAIESKRMHTIFFDERSPQGLLDFFASHGQPAIKEDNKNQTSKITE
jgi:2-polyprenyl-6-methoxyphenol hydroxylase-like FAD-dependent oxidoreductase